MGEPQIFQIKSMDSSERDGQTSRIYANYAHSGEIWQGSYTETESLCNILSSRGTRQYKHICAKCHKEPTFDFPGIDGMTLAILQCRVISTSSRPERAVVFFG